MKKYNTPHRRRVIKTRLTEEEYAEFSERVTLCKMSQAEFIRQALIKSSIRPVITVSPVNDELLSAVGKLTTEYGKIGGNLNQIARCLNEYGAPSAANFAGPTGVLPTLSTSSTKSPSRRSRLRRMRTSRICLRQIRPHHIWKTRMWLARIWPRRIRRTPPN